MDRSESEETWEVEDVDLGRIIARDPRLPSSLSDSAMTVNQSFLIVTRLNEVRRLILMTGTRPKDKGDDGSGE